VRLQENVMALIPPPISHTALAIDEAMVANAMSSDSAGVPMSAVGNPCDRALFYAFRWAFPPEPPDARRERRFRTGFQYERWLLDDLRAAGCEVLEIDEETGRQFRVELVDGHLRGKIDGRVTGLPEAPRTEHVVECKSLNDKAFREVVKKGLQTAKPDHYAQCQLYCHATGLTRCLYLAANKNTDEIHAERIPHNMAFCLALVARIERIVHAAHPPARLHDDPNSKAAFACQWCPALAVCHEGAFARVNCRTCLSSSAIDGGRWHCERWDRELSYSDQQAACPSHQFIPELVPGEQEDVIGEDTILYRLPDGSEWLDGAR
jgi:hypothetical protein